MCASTPARAAYAASAPPALPALGTASFVAPRYFAIETATLIPRALKLCVGLSDSSLIQRSTSSVKLREHVAAAFRLHLTTPAQHRMATATLRDNATMIFPARAVSRGSGFDSRRRDRRLQTAVYCRSHKDFVAETIRAHVRTRCIRDASKTSEQLKRTSARIANCCRPFAVRSAGPTDSQSHTERRPLGDGYSKRPALCDVLDWHR